MGGQAYNRGLSRILMVSSKEFHIPRKEPKLLRKMEMGWDSGLAGLVQSKFQFLVIMSLCSWAIHVTLIILPLSTQVYK